MPARRSPLVATPATTAIATTPAPRSTRRSAPARAPAPSPSGTAPREGAHACRSASQTIATTANTTPSMTGTAGSEVPRAIWIARKPAAGSSAHAAARARSASDVVRTAATSASRNGAMRKPSAAGTGATVVSSCFHDVTTPDGELEPRLERRDDAGDRGLRHGERRTEEEVREHRQPRDGEDAPAPPRRQRGDRACRGWRRPTAATR